MEENKPPGATATAKLKQAKLSFFKSTPVSVKTNTLGQGKKRRNSGSSCLDSPTKSAKPGKPLNPITADNTECQNTKAHKIRKICNTKKNDGNDHEVSSSSEAEAGNTKCISGKLDRFVCKWSQDPHHEISSTNEMFEICQQNEIANEDLKNTVDGENHLQSGATEPDCIVIEDSMDAKVDKSDAAPRTKESLEMVKPEPEAPNESEDVTNLSCKDIKLKDVEVEVREDFGEGKPCEDVNDVESDKPCEDVNDVESDKPCEDINDVESDKPCEDINIVESDKPCEDINDTESDVNKSVSDNDTSITHEENLDDSIKDISVLSLACSTPIRGKDSDVSDPDQTADLSVINPVTPASGSGKRKRKVDSGKKAETEFTKQKREAERLEKKRKLEEEKAEKERVKKEKKDALDKLKQEQKEKLEKERLEKEKAKEEERKKKEEERLKREEEKKKKQAALEAKQEEKRKKEEERKKKEEERKQKEDEKLREEEDKKKKNEKTKQAFQSFFIKPKDNSVKPATPKSGTGMFIPFELKKDMHLAPAVRRDALTEDKKHNLDQILANSENCVNTYLEQLKNGDVKPHRTGRILRVNPQPEEDVEVIHDSEALKKVTYCVKILQFHTDYRPPYYGTWRKKPSLSARNPWKKDESVFDYEVDSDEEWEEEEPGESLSCSDGEEEKAEDADEDDDDGDGWMVPHGYLSEDEGCNEDDEITPEKLKLQQLAKAKAWEEDQKRKLRVAPAITVACFFENSPSLTMAGDVRLLYEYKAVMLVTVPVQTSLFGCPEPEKSEDADSEGVTTASSQKGFQKKSVPDEAMPDLIRLVHGNICGIKRLIREFRVYWLRKTNPPTNPDDEVCEKDEADDSFSEKNDVSGLNESLAECSTVVDADEQLCDVPNNNEDEQKKVREEGYGCSISKRQLELKVTSMACREKRPGFNKICWYVHEKILTQFNMSDIKLPNSWEHILPMPARVQVLNKTAESPGNLSESNTPRANKNMKVSAKNKVSKSGSNSEVTAEVKDDDTVEGKETSLKKINKDQRSIKDFACSKDEIVKKSETQTPMVSSNSPVLPSGNASESQTPQAIKNMKVSAKNKLSKSGGSIEAAAEVKDDEKLEGKETPLKRISKDQRSIKDFACSKDEIVKKCENQTPVVSSESPVIASDRVQKTPKRKKPNAQKSIIEFTNKSGNKKSVKKKCQQRVVSNTPSNQDQGVICIDVDSDHDAIGSCTDQLKPVGCSETTAPVSSAVCTSSVVEASDAVSSVEIPVQSLIVEASDAVSSVEIPVQSSIVEASDAVSSVEIPVSGTGNNEESMEVDETNESSREDTTVEPHTGVEAGEKDGMECEATG